MKNKLKFLEHNITDRYFFSSKIHTRFHSSGLPIKTSPFIIYVDSLSNKAKVLKDNKGKSGVYR